MVSLFPQDELTSKDLIDDGCHLNHKGAKKTARRIGKALTRLETAGFNAQVVAVGRHFFFRFRIPVHIWKAALAMLLLQVLYSLRRR